MPSGQWEWLKVYLNRIGTAQADKIGLDVFKAGKIKWPAARIMTNSIFGGGSGIWPTDGSCASSLPGLYAAGNSCGTMASGAMYASMGFSLNHAAVTGARSGIGAAEYASKSGRVSLNEAVLSSARQAICEPVVRKGGFSPGWLTQVLQGITVPYFILSIKHEERLRAALTIVEFLESHIVPKIVATGSHEWRMAHETRNMILIAEMRLRASLFRTESRGNHFREDYPQRDDPTWLAWVKLKEEQGRMKLWKEPIPRQWWPDLSKPLEVNYPRILPME
jgi:succinate dehydrogenase/fumarate reductase flavoprotein subunit